MVDPAEGIATYLQLDAWLQQAAALLNGASVPAACADAAPDVPAVPTVRIAAGVHPHNAKAWTDDLEATLLRVLADQRTSAVGEIGLDYHYDKSPRPVQQQVFKRQLHLAQQAELPVILHVREAFDDAFAIMEQADWNPAGVLLHCYTSGPTDLQPWLEAGCFVAFGGAATFGKSDDIREALATVPADRLLLETDAPFMTPVPLRGEPCEPAHTLFTADFFKDSAPVKRAFQNTLALLDRPPTPWQLKHGVHAEGKA